MGSRACCGSYEGPALLRNWARIDCTLGALTWPACVHKRRIHSIHEMSAQDAKGRRRRSPRRRQPSRALIECLGPQRSGLQMRLLDALVEQRIAAAAARGEFDDLPGAGAPLTLDDDALVPEEVRVANRILKNAGFVPPAMEQLRALRDLQSELSAVSDQATRCRLQARMLALHMALESLRGGPLVLPREYCRRIAERLSERASNSDMSAVEGSPANVAGSGTQ